ncbi:hypothetical protein [Pseudooceanicola sp. MF1-13]|uniref:hypothetical protein n=1 Tax=Pseudooceanicola sp. MF1-13 TaxID=3379095 RepID=UPI0038922D0F
MTTQTTDVGPRPRVPADRILGGMILALMGCELLARMTDAVGLQIAAWGVMGITVVMAIPRFRFREAYMLSLCVALSVMLVIRFDDPVAELGPALSQASFLMAFVMLLGLLHEAAGTSPSITALGQFLSRQPAGRRFYALFGGTGLMSILFNLGVVSFLVPLIQRGIQATAPDDPLNPVRERRQVSALLRGFAWAVIWSPTAVAPLALMELIPDIDRQLWIIMGMCIFLAYMVFGAIEDRIRFRAYKPRPGQHSPSFPGHAVAMFALSCGWLFALAITVSTIFDETIILGLMAACPVMLVGWLAVQNGKGAQIRWSALGQRLNGIAFGNLPNSARMAVTLGCAGFIGRAASGLIPAQAVADGLGLQGVPDFLLLSAIPPAIATMSLFGLSPIMTAVFFGSFFGGLAVLPADPTLIALSISMGWSVSMLLSPLSTVVIMINRVGNIGTTVLTWRWNLTYGLLCMLANIPVFALLVALFGLD